MTQSELRNDQRNLVKALVKEPIEIYSHMTMSKCQALHPLLGLCSEIDELDEAISTMDKDNLKEELGDLLFYLTDMEMWAETSYGYIYSEIPEGEMPSPHDCVICINKGVSKLADHIKRYVIYDMPLSYVKEGKMIPLSQSITIDLVMIRYHIECLCEHEIEGGFEAVIAHNRMKLEERYPNKKYSDADAAARADKA